MPHEMTKLLACPPQHSDMVVAVHSQMDFDELLRRRCSEPTPVALQPMRHFADSTMRERSSSMNELNASHTNYDIDVEAQEHMRMSSTASIIDPAGYRDTICMCVQAPRIPRPRNAFILYRQYHQSHVMSENPSLSNPEISRIIGEKWKNEELEVKEDWKKLAEKEKQRHASRYPNYRYQPRRSVKPQGWTASTLEEDQGRCPKCKGRLTSLTPRKPADPEMSPITPTRTGITHTPGTKPRPSLDRLDTDVPRWWSIGSSSPIPINRPPFPTRPMPFVSPEADAMSPDSKRRRTTSVSDYHLVSGLPDTHAGMSMREPRRLSQEAGGWRQDFMKRASMETPLPELGTLPGLGRLPMPPPPRPSESWVRHEQDNVRARNHNSFDESLRLPPLRSSNSPGPRSANNLNDGRLGRSMWDAGSPNMQHDRVRGFVVASDMMTTISYRMKLSILARVCRPAPPLSSPMPSPLRSPLRVPSLDRPFATTRGAFIAMEGSDPRLLREIGLAVEHGLADVADIRLKTWGGQVHNNLDVTPSREETFLPASVSRMYFETLEQGQEISQEVVHHITTAGEDGSSHSSQTARTPVALVKDGFSLTLTDKLARATRNTDNYSPLDHWKWMASLWRGTACPDLVIYVKPCDAEEANQLGTVEVWKQIGLMVIRVSPGQGLHESAERRLMVELVKWIREGTFRDPVAPDWRAE